MSTPVVSGTRCFSGQHAVLMWSSPIFLSLSSFIWQREGVLLLAIEFPWPPPPETLSWWWFNNVRNGFFFGPRRRGEKILKMERENHNGQWELLLRVHILIVWRDLPPPTQPIKPFPVQSRITIYKKENLPPLQQKFRWKILSNSFENV